MKSFDTILAQSIGTAIMITVGSFAVMLIIAYLLIKKSVKDAIKEAYKEIEEEKKLK